MVKGLMAKGVPPQPAWLLYIKIAILVLSVIILALSAYACSLVYWASGVPAYMIFIVRLPFSNPHTARCAFTV